MEPVIETGEPDVEVATDPMDGARGLALELHKLDTYAKTKGVRVVDLLIATARHFMGEDIRPPEPKPEEKTEP